MLAAAAAMPMEIGSDLVDLDLIELSEEAELSESKLSENAMALKVELRNLHKLTSRAQVMMAANSEATLKLKVAATTKQAEAEIPITGAGEGTAITSVEGSMDMAAAPCGDFYSYSCGKWVNDTTIPGDRASWSRSFGEISKRNLKSLQGIMNGTVVSEVAEQQVSKVTSFYKSCMNMNKKNATAFSNPEFVALTTQVLGATTIKQLSTVWAKMELKGYAVAPFDFGPGVDDRDPENHVAFVGQGGISLPGPEYYLQDNPRFTTLKTAYVKLLDDIAAMVKVPNFNYVAGTTGAAILAFETKLAQKMWTKVQMRDPKATYNPTTATAFQAAHLTFVEYFTEITAAWPKFTGASKLVISTPPFLTDLETTLNTEVFANVQAYTMMKLVRQLAPKLDEEVATKMFAFFGTLMNGVKVRPALWKRCVDETSESLWEISDQVFVEHHFTGDSKTKANDMISGVKEAFGARLDALTWMDATTKTGAKAKLESLVTKVGFPDKWRTYENMTIGTNYFTNFLTIKNDMVAREYKKFGSPVDKSKWHMNPSLVNAYYSPSSNEMVFPAGILQPPFFSADFPVVMNYGAMGSVMGHELSHAFDDQGAQYDSTGKMQNWFSNASMKAFANKTKCYADQYSGYNVTNVGVNMAVNGKLTLGENIADNAGVSVSLDAYLKWAETNNPPRKFMLNNKQVTDIQLFWIAFGQVYCSKQQPEALMMQIRNDPHSPGEVRSFAPPANEPRFATAFQCAAGTKMKPAAPCALW